MNLFICKLIIVLSFSAPVYLFLSLAQAEKINLYLGGKNIATSYFPSVRSIAESFNRKSSPNGIRITIKSKRESTSIIRDVMSGKLNFGVARLNNIYQAYNGLAEWEGNPATGLRSVFNVHGEQITLLASIKSGILTLQDLKSQRVFIGTPRSDLHHTVSDILSAAGIDPANDLTVTSGTIDETADMLVDDEIDAFFIHMGIINRTFIDLLSRSKKIRLVPIKGKGIDQMIETNPFYGKATIGNQEYPYLANHPPVKVLSVMSCLITTEKTWDKTTYTVVRDVISYRDVFKNLYPNADILTREEMTQNMVAPLHPGAAEYYQEYGIPYDLLKP